MRIRVMGGYGTTALGAKRSFDEASGPKSAKERHRLDHDPSAQVMRWQVIARDSGYRALPSRSMH